MPELRPHNANLCICLSAAAAKASRKSACFCAAIAERGTIAEQAGLISHMSEFPARRRSLSLPTYAMFPGALLQRMLPPVISGLLALCGRPNPAGKMVRGALQ